MSRGSVLHVLAAALALIFAVLVWRADSLIAVGMGCGYIVGAFIGYLWGYVEGREKLRKENNAPSVTK